MVKRFCGGIRKASIALALVETAAKCRAGAPSPRRSTIHCRAILALVSVSSVEKVFEQTTNSVRAAIDLFQHIAELHAVDVGDAVQAQIAVAILGQRLGGHDDAEVRAPDADIDDVGEGLAGMAMDAAAVNSFDEAAHLLQAGAHFRHDILTIDGDRPVGAVTQSDVQYRALLSAVDFLAGEHRVDASTQAASFSELQQSIQRRLIDQLPREIEQQIEITAAREIAGARRVRGEQISQMSSTQLICRCREPLPFRKLSEVAHGRSSYI